MIVKTKEEYIADFINQFLDKLITSKFIHQHHNDFPDIQEFISMNLKKEFNWMTGIGLYESAEHSFNEAKKNSNFNGKLGFKISGLENWMRYVCVDDYGEVYGSEIEPTPEIDKYGKRLWSAGDNRWFVLIDSDEIDCYNLLEYGLYKVKHSYELKKVKVSEEEKVINDIDDNTIDFIINTNDIKGIDFKLFRIYSPVVHFIPFSEYGGTVEKYTVKTNIIYIDKKDVHEIFDNIINLKSAILQFLYNSNEWKHDIYVYSIRTSRKETSGTITIRYFEAHKNYRDWTIHNIGGI